jgi:hypothetical protein
MYKKLALTGLVTSFFIFSLGCEPLDVLTGGEDCTGAGAAFERDFMANGIYVDPDFRSFEMTVELENFVDYRISAKDVGELAFFMTVAHKQMELPRANETDLYLSNGYWVVVEDDNIFEQLFGNTYPASQIGAFWTPHPCFKTPPGARWASVIRSKYWQVQGIDVIVHEMTHGLSLATYGTADSGHLSPQLWLNFGKDTLMDRTMRMWEEKYKVDLETNNF